MLFPSVLSRHILPSLVTRLAYSAFQEKRVSHIQIYSNDWNRGFTFRVNLPMKLHNEQ